MPASALNEINVLDLAGEPAALAGRILADLGADVILVEPPEGNRLRHLAPFVDDQPGEDRSYRHLYFNANKRSIVLDLHREADADKLRSLARSADVLIEGQQPGVMSSLGLGFDDLRALNPGIIYVSVSPYGQSGPRRDWKATDLTAEAASGMLQICGEAEDPPAKGPADPAYAMAGLAAAAGSLIAIHGRKSEPDSPGVHIDISLQEATMAALVQTSNPNHYLWRGEIPTRPALSQAMKCADGKWAGANILGNRIEGFIAVLDEVGVEHTLTPDNWADMHSTSGAWRFLENPIQYLAMDAAARLPRDVFLEKLWKAGSAAMPIYTFPEIAQSEHYAATNQFSDVSHPPL
ncbi:MAG: CoA transferase, partial [Armatimonadetes bacterium]|nr:CoA transferase [Armatimonadota bacterium]